MITVFEVWHLKPQYRGSTLQVMQEMDELVGPPAHRDPAWSGHARFYQSRDRPDLVLMVYAWRSIEDHKRLAAAEDPMLRSFVERYCSAPREISYHDELPVDVDHDDLSLS